MSKIIIGIDPDSKAHGVAFYVDGRLEEMKCLNLPQFIEALEPYANNWRNTFEIHIEDVCAVSASFMARDKKANINVKLKMAQHIGMCKQSQVEFERFIADTFPSIKIVKHKISKMWKKDKAQFEKVTGWTGRSNEDTRSAAYFGFLGLK